jgi:FixJ family two-component response regulator
VAIVDDDKELRDALARLLQASGCTVHTFATAESFLEFGLRRRVTCLILDVGLPGMSGIELQRRLHEEETRFPTLFISAGDDACVRHSASEAGCAAFLKKPVSGQVLLEQIDAALQRSASGTKV